MLDKILGAATDARVVAAARMIGAAVLVAALGAIEKILLDPGWSGYAWAPVALMLIRLAEGFFDHADETRSG